MAARENILTKVQKLIDKADDPGCSEAEAEAFRSKAEELILKHAIEQAELERLSGSRTEDPINKYITITEGHKHIRQQLGDMFSTIARYNRCRVVFHGYNYSDGPLYATIVGFPTDIDFCEMLYASLLLEISRNIQPTADLALTYEQNLVKLKEAGMKWADIYGELNRIGQMDRPFTRNVAVKFTKDYTRICEREGRDRMYVQPATHQKSWMEGFLGRITTRIYEDYQRRETNLRSHTNGRGTDIILRNRNERVDAAYDDLFSSVKMGTARRNRSKISDSSYLQGDKAARKASLGHKSVSSRKQLT